LPETRLPADAQEAAAPARLTRRGLISAGAVGAAGAAVLATAGPAAAVTTAAAPTAAKRPNPARRRRARHRLAPTSPKQASLPNARKLLAESRDLVDHEMVELAALLRSGATTSVEITQAYIDRINTFNGPYETYAATYGYNAFVRIDEAGALAAAAAADKLIQAERNGGPKAHWLCGMPFGFKDSIGTKGFKQQNGTIDFAGNVANDDSGPVKLLRAVGVVPVGITMCSSYSSSIIGGVTGNAWDYTRVTGGSSQGSGAAPVARLIAGTLGEETGGSIAIPSSVNGATGIKPSTGLVPTNGVMPLTPGVDVIGPIVRSARDAALTLNVIAQATPDDPQTFNAPRPFPGAPLEARPGDKPLAGITIGLPQTDWMSGGTTGSPQARYQAGYLAVFNRVRQELTAMGATIVEFPWVNTNLAAQDPFFSSASVLGVVDGTNITPRNAVAYGNRAESRYVDAVLEWANTRPAKQKADMVSQYGRTSGGVLSLENQIAFLNGITQSIRAEAERRRRQLVANCNQSLADYGVDFMMVMTHASVPTTTTIPVYRTNYQLPNQLGWPMVNIPVGRVALDGTTVADMATPGMPASIAFWGPRFSEPELVQAALDYQARHPEWHQARPDDPWDEAVTPTAGKRAGEAPARISAADQAELERKAQDPAYSTDVTVTEASRS
jgi:Asp-tRNA(Asn)/Glu-tRNA(Gln) amidotransferase A subunit family amidase